MLSLRVSPVADRGVYCCVEGGRRGGRVRAGVHEGRCHLHNHKPIALNSTRIDAASLYRNQEK